MKRLLLVFAAMAVMAMVLAVMAMPAFAVEGCPGSKHVEQASTQQRDDLVHEAIHNSKAAGSNFGQVQKESSTTLCGHGGD